MKRKYKQVYAILVAFVIVAAAYTCRMLAMYDIGGKYPSNIRAVLYLLLFALWGYSIDRRILQKQALHQFVWTSPAVVRVRNLSRLMYYQT